jgi:FkbM family methyltransferase
MAKRWAQVLCRVLASRPASRTLLNIGYDFLPIKTKARFHRAFTELFEEQDRRLIEGEWHVRFNGTDIRLPLRRTFARLDWTAAISILGHETEIKSTYAQLLADRDRPIDIFLDVGANFGTHSILFAANRVRVLAFEPNADCEPYCMAVAALNRLSISWIKAALSDHEGEVDLVYPKTRTWLGSIEPNMSGALSQQFEGCVTTRVRLGTLDRYAGDLPSGSRILLKIDVEGGELSVLRGARSLLQRPQAPLIIFESNDTAGRAELGSLLAGYGYRLFTLPFGRKPGTPPLALADFLADSATNFIAVPSGADVSSFARARDIKQLET